MTDPGVRRPVVVGVDPRSSGKPVLACGADEAHRRGLPLLLVHVVPSLHREGHNLGATHEKNLIEQGTAHRNSGHFMAWLVSEVTRPSKLALSRIRCIAWPAHNQSAGRSFDVPRRAR
ncbi:hypothetical protein [Streptomyces sp. NBC_01794]|uniref:hypothetical protein n=1 Tax=Streptomyces sp. NBC_01794 TaxID=2975942 RepID=UPI0030866A98|nr:hypothetical protein OIE54_37300 [Streptomyces sp. NBC_01794]